MRVFAREYHHCDDPWGREVPPWAVELREMVLIIIQNQEAIMATLNDVLTDVTDETTRLDSISTLIAGLKQQVADALSGATLPPAVQSQVDAIFAAAETNKGKIDTALNANVPAPTPAPTP